MATTYIVRKNSRNDLKDRPGYERFASSGRPTRSGGPKRRPQGGGGGRPQQGGGRPSGNRPRKRGRGNDSFIDPSRFINKARPVANEDVFVPVNSFTDFPIDQQLKDNLIARNYLTPTPIQDESIPHVLKGKDIVGLANTGTGKTAAFLIPLIDKVLKLRALGETERVLIMVPTRELAIQIETEFWGFAKKLMLNSVVCVGGANIEPQVRVLRKDPAFVIGTPGRLKDLMERRELNLSKFGTVVLDEADRMLDMGFIDDMRFILSKMPEKRHTLFFSATMEPSIERLIGDFFHHRQLGEGR